MMKMMVAKVNLIYQSDKVHIMANMYMSRKPETNVSSIYSDAENCSGVCYDYSVNPQKSDRSHVVL